MVSYAPLIDEADVVPVAPRLAIWDAWPLQEIEGRPWRLRNGDQVWMALAAPRFDDPDLRHAHARIHLFLRNDAGWRHLGPAMPDEFAPGSREWTGSAIVTGDVMTLYFTAAGRRGEQIISFEQRLFSAQATVHLENDGIACRDWRNLREVIPPNDHYMATRGGNGVLGQIKAFRDPGYFYEPKSQRHYIFFAGSLAGSRSQFNGVVGAALSDDGVKWTLRPPVISADKLNNELERPHVIRHGGRYYMFWSTQRHVFNREGPQGPTGLYGMTSTALLEGWQPLNGTGLVFANPKEAPAQSYSWFVLPDLSVASFVDDWGGSGERRFGGTFAPFLKLSLNGTHAVLEPPQ